MSLHDLLEQLPPGLRVAVILLAAVLVGLATHAVLYRGFARMGQRAPSLLVFDGILLRLTRAPTRLLFPLLAIRAAFPLLHRELEPATMDVVQVAMHVLLVAAFTWGLLALTRVLDDVVIRRFDVDTPDNVRARRVRTQVGLLRRVLVVAIVVLAIGAVLMRFQGFRALGTTLLASAGLIGIMFSIAAQRPLGNIVAGVQLALTQPIRVGDAIVIEDEWGTVEEITLTYVVIRIWDQRRLVLPISYFFERPFQNWTRSSAQVIGTVFLHVDYTAPVGAIREEFDRVVRSSPFWDGQVSKLQVSDASERTMQLRAIMTAADAGLAWDLRCDVRERLIDFLQREHPGSLPRLRLDDGQPPAG